MFGYEKWRTIVRREGRAHMTCVSMFKEEGISERETTKVCTEIIDVVKQRYRDLEVARDPQIAEEIADLIRSKYILDKLGREKLTGIILKMANTKTNYEILKEGLNLIGIGVSLVSLIKMVI